MYRRFMRSRLIEPDPYTMSQRSLQPPAVTSVHVGVTKQGSTPRSLATSFVVSLSKPVSSVAVSCVGRHFVLAGRVAPSTAIDCGG